MQKALDKFFKGAEAMMGFFLALMVIFTLLNVILRYCFNSGLVWSEEAAKFLFIWSIYIGAVGAARDNQHIIVRALLDKLPGLSQKIVYGAGQALSAMVMIMLAMGSYFLAAQNIHSKASATGVPMFLIYGIGIFMGVGIAIVNVANIIRLIHKKASVQELLLLRGAEEDAEKLN